MSQNPNLFLSVGRPVKDEYGRIIGKVASFAITPNGKFDAVFVEFNSGQFSKTPMEQMKFTGSEVTFISTVKAQSSVLCDQMLKSFQTRFQTRLQPARKKSKP
jgi:hypothetical protein